MKERILISILVVFIALIFGVMFNSVQQMLVLTENSIVQQGELLDIVRSLDAKVSSSVGAMTQVAGKVNKMSEIFENLKNQPSGKKGPQAPQEDFNKVYDIPIGNSAVKGNPDAPITIVGFLDLQCPFSKRFQPVINQVLEAYPEKVKYVVKDFPLGFHKQALPAAKAVLAAGEQGKFFEMMQLVLDNNKELNAEKYEEFAKQLGLNIAQFKSSLEKNDQAWNELIKKDAMMGQRVDVRGTPTFYLNGKKTRARSLDAFKAEIDAILKAK